MKRKLTIKLSSFQIITLGFIGIILLGAILLMFPISSKSGAPSALRGWSYTTRLYIGRFSVK